MGQDVDANAQLLDRWGRLVDVNVRDPRVVQGQGQSHAADAAAHDGDLHSGPPPGGAADQNLLPDVQSMATSHQVYEKHGGHRQVSPRRCAFQCCADLGVLEFGVAERRTNVAMAQHALHDLHALALGDELAAPRVTKLMGCISRSTRLVDQARRLAHSGPLIVQRVIGHPGAAIRQEHHLVVGSRDTPMRSSCRT